MSDWESVAASESVRQDFPQFSHWIFMEEIARLDSLLQSEPTDVVFDFFFFWFLFIVSRMLLEKSTAEKLLLFSVMVSDQTLTLRYGQNQPAISFRTEGRLPLGSWTHLVLQVTNIKPSPVTEWHVLCIDMALKELLHKVMNYLDLF